MATQNNTNKIYKVIGFVRRINNTDKMFSFGFTKQEYYQYLFNKVYWPTVIKTILMIIGIIGAFLYQPIFFVCGILCLAIDIRFFIKRRMGWQYIFVYLLFGFVSSDLLSGLIYASFAMGIFTLMVRQSFHRVLSDKDLDMIQATEKSMSSEQQGTIQSMHLSKSDFLKYQICPSYFWLWKHNRDVVPQDEEETIKRRLEQGNEVEAYARTLFPGGTLIQSFGGVAQETMRQLAASGAHCIYQATVITPRGLLAMADILVRQNDESWALYEVKSTNSVKPEHLSDIAFQKITFEEAGYNISKLVIIHLDKTYVRNGEVEAIDLLMQSDVTAEAEALLPDLRLKIDDAMRVLAIADEPKTCSCRLKTKSGHCPTFHYLNPDIPEYSVFHITRISGKQLEVLVDDNIFNVEDVPDDIDLTFRQKNQIQTAKTLQPIIDRKGVAEKLKPLKFPLYFFDYEAISTAVPIFDGTTPFQQIPFQYSLHILREPDGELEHLEFLASSADRNPIPELLDELKRTVGTTGSVIVWYQVFEKGRNTEMAAMYPEYERFLLDINSRIFDLMDVFEHQHYVHHGFHGRTSIKKVLPVLIPDLSYKELEIQGGEAAALAWYEAVLNTSDEREKNKTFDALLKYCCLDTLAMVKIYEHLIEKL